MTPDNSVIHQIPKRNTRPKQAQDKSVNNEEGDGNTKDTDVPTVYMAWTYPVQDNKAQFIIDTGCLGSHIFKNTELVNSRSQVQRSRKRLQWHGAFYKSTWILMLYQSTSTRYA